jgi:hypothetical protein
VADAPTIDASLIDASLIDASLIDARPPMIDADPPMIDAAPPMIDADVPDSGLVCADTANATSCPSETCPNGPGICCVYISTNNNISCTDTCAAVGLTCSSAYEGNGTCSAGTQLTCGNKDSDNICFCQ